MRRHRLVRVIRTVGTLCLVFSLIFVPPIIVAELYQDHQEPGFLVSLIITLGLGLLLWFPTRKQHTSLHRKDGFLIIALVWGCLSFLSSLPFDLVLHTSVVDSLFEAVSGITTTGATVLADLDSLPPSLLFYRQELQWFGGMGLVVLAIAVIPQLGIGGMSIYKAEVPGVMKEEKLTPRLNKTASMLWKIYLLLTLLCAASYWAAGMSGYDAIAHSLSTVSTGGFSTHNLSMGYFHSELIEGIAILFMVLGATNFSLHFVALRHRSIKGYWRNSELRTFLFIVISSSLLITLLILYFRRDNPLLGTLHDALFTVVSMITSTGFVTEDYSTWPVFIPFFLIVIGFVGGCGGSTAGGMKVMRIQVLAKLVGREVKRLLHPKGVFPIRLGRDTTIPQGTLQSVFGFFALYIASFVVLILLMSLDGVDQVTAFSAVATCMNNMGPGLGDIVQSFSGLNDPAKLIAIVSMLLGRLEVVSVMILLSPEYWKN